MTTQEWSVLSFLFGISLASFTPEVQSSFFMAAIGSMICMIVGYSTWRFYFKPQQHLALEFKQEHKHSALQSFHRTR